MKNKLFLIILLSIFSASSFAQQEIKLYPKGPKENNGFTEKESWARPNDFLTKISDPRMYYYPAPAGKGNGTAVLICPGGGYVGVSIMKEGKEIAEWFNNLGVTAFVLYYRMPNGHYKVPLADAQKALKIIHKNAKVWNIDKNKIGIMGFSAGGHLASTAGTHFKTKIQRPAFMILGYPVVTMDKNLTHAGSRENLLGNNPSDKLVKFYSNELQVKKNTPPTFIVHARDDKTVPIANSRNLAKAIQEKGISCTLQEYDLGGHGFGMRKNNIPADNWPEVLKIWLKEQHLIQ